MRVRPELPARQRNDSDDEQSPFGYFDHTGVSAPFELGEGGRRDDGETSDCTRDRHQCLLPLGDIPERRP
jgi:hypothetical protein